LRSYLSKDDLAPARAGLIEEFPTADEFHNGVEPARNERFHDEFAGITDFQYTDRRTQGCLMSGVTLGSPWSAGLRVYTR
jgi:hypothetical protein